MKGALRKARAVRAKSLTSLEGEEPASAIPSEPPPLPPPPSPPPLVEPLAEELVEKGFLWNRKLRVCDESEGPTKYGLEGECVSHNVITGAVQLGALVSGGKATMVLSHAEKCCVVDPKWAKNYGWKQCTLSRALKQEILESVGLLSRDDHGDVLPPDELIPVTTGQLKAGLLDQHLSLGLELLQQWHWTKIAQFKGGNVRCLSPSFLDRLYSVWDAEEEEQVKMRSACLDYLQKIKQGEKALVLCAVFCSDHYVLLSLELDSGVVEAVRYFDTLTVPSEACRDRCQWILSIFADGEQLPERSNTVFQAKKTLSCGQWVLSYAEIEAARHVGFGPAACGHPGLLKLNWESRLQVLSSQLVIELQKTALDEIARKKADAKRAELAALKLDQLAKQADEKKALGQMLSIEEEIAVQFINQGKQLSLDDLPHEVKLRLSKIAEKEVGICGSCRYSSGCLRCNVWKAQRYYLRKEAERRGVPCPTTW